RGHLRRGARHRRGRALRPREARPAARPRRRRVRGAHAHPAGGAVGMRILLATRNPGKIAELRRILTGFDVVGLEEFPAIGDVAETGVTFEENALLKAREVA